jgi:hypothetical protein
MFICLLSTFKLTAHKKVTLNNDPKVTAKNDPGCMTCRPTRDEVLRRAMASSLDALITTAKTIDNHVNAQIDLSLLEARRYPYITSYEDEDGR